MLLPRWFLIHSLLPLATCLLPVSTAGAMPRMLTQPGELPTLTTTLTGKETPFPLQHTDVKVSLSGTAARVEVTQTYQNPFGVPLEGIYLFPLPENSAVGSMKIVIGDRVIASKIAERGEARRTFDDAKRAGHTAALLEQERPNLFTQTIANIAPHTTIDVVLSYQQELTYDAGRYEFVFPMTVGPRFMPGSPLPKPDPGPGTHRHTTGVPDASRISPPFFPEGTRSGHDISLQVTIAGALKIQTWNVPTHDVIETPTPKNALSLSLAPTDSIPNRDFLLHYRLAGDRPEAMLLTHQEGSEGYFALHIEPPTLNIEALVGQREFIFVVDVSGSMRGVPLAMCQDAMKKALSMLRPVDTFNVFTFAGRTGAAFLEPVEANQSRIREALAFVQNLHAGGGTQMANAVTRALTPSPSSEDRHRYVFFLTDGYVGNEQAIFSGAASLVRALAEEGQRARVFGFGVGSSVNRHLLDGLSAAGEGITVYSSTREDPHNAVNRFFHYVDHPVLENIEVHWGDGEVHDVLPSRIPDLFASRPLVLRGRYTALNAGTLTVTGTRNGERVEIPLRISPSEAAGRPAPEVRALWARSKINDLNRSRWGGTPPPSEEEFRAAVTTLGLRYSLLTAYTSLVAVDSATRVSTDTTQTVVQPLYIPEGVHPVLSGARGPHPAQRALLSSQGFLQFKPRTKRPTTFITPESGGLPVRSPSTLPSPREKERHSPAVSSVFPTLQKELAALQTPGNQRCLPLSSAQRRLLKGAMVHFYITPTGEAIGVKLHAPSPLPESLRGPLLKCLTTTLGHLRARPHYRRARTVFKVPLHWILP